MTTAQANLQAAKEALDAAQKLRDSREKLFRDGALARRQVDEAQVGYAQARSQFETARQHLVRGVAIRADWPALVALGQQFALEGTPAIVMPSGEMLPGYVPPDVLAAHLKDEK